MRKNILALGILGLQASFISAHDYQRAHEQAEQVDIKLYDNDVAWAHGGRGNRQSRGGHSHDNAHEHRNGHKYGKHGRHDHDDNWRGGHRRGRGSWNNRGKTGFSSYGGGYDEGGYIYPAEEPVLPVVPAVRPLRVVTQTPAVVPVNVAPPQDPNE